MLGFFSFAMRSAFAVAKIAVLAVTRLAVLGSSVKDCKRILLTLKTSIRFNRYCKARSCICPQPYDQDFDLSMLDLFGICHEAVWVPT